MSKEHLPSEAQTDSFSARHIGPTAEEAAEMAKALGFDSVESFIQAVIPAQIRLQKPLTLSRFQEPAAEHEALARIGALAVKNKVYRSFIGQGYFDCIVPPVIQRNILENPGWYTQYTPYQPEISQGRLEALLNFQTMICDLTALQVANASLLDEATAAAEAMGMCVALKERSDDPSAKPRFFVSNACHPQTISVVRTRGHALGIDIVVGDASTARFDASYVGVLLQYPDTFGELRDPSEVIARAHEVKALAVLAADLLALALVRAPGELGADIAIGSAQRFGVPLGFGGPHAAFMAVRDEYKRLMPGRLIGLSKDRAGRPALRLALQTREQHIRREKATSNICTAQVLLAVMASMYAVYHGPRGIRRIAARVHELTRALAQALTAKGVTLATDKFFDTLTITGGVRAAEVRRRAEADEVNLRYHADGKISLSLDERSDEREVERLVALLTGSGVEFAAARGGSGISKDVRRNSSYLTHPVFNTYHSETEFLRYVRRLEARDLSLGTAMIPLGSCTMKLNATSEMLPVTWPQFSSIHPFAPAEQTQGYRELFKDLESALAEITGFDAVSLQPNSGAQGEYAGLMAIQGYHQARGDARRTICLIPRSAHGINQDSAVMDGMEVVVVNCDEHGNIDIADLKLRAEEHRDRLSALMATYPSTHGVFEEAIKEAFDIIHRCGGQVYMDGANLNAQVGLCRPADIGADVCHINLHKTFCIPHGGGGPGMGPIAVKRHLAPHLPGHPIVALGVEGGAVSAAPWGSASILPISWMYMAMMGAANLRRATMIAILNANYIAHRLGTHYPVLYRGKSGFVAHECILDVRPIKKTSGVEAEDVAKRLMDYGFHAPTVSFPVAGSLMVEPTESESKRELDRFCEAMIAIRKEIEEIEKGSAHASDNLLKNAPHTALEIASDAWSHRYSRERAAFPTAGSREFKFWPAAARVDSVYGDRNLVCTCPDIGSYSKP